jgi:cytochrome-b5 reductase
MSSDQSDPLLAKHYRDYIYIPAALIVVGTLIVKREWTPYSIAVALAFGVYNHFQFQVKKVLKPDVFQGFELKEKIIISHNVAM